MIRYYHILKWLWLLMSISGFAAFIHELYFARIMSPWYYAFFCIFSAGMSLMNHLRIGKLKNMADGETSN